MKDRILLFLFLIPVFLFAQYPTGTNKARLGYQTTGDGLIWRGVAGDTVNKPNSRNYPYFQLDTVNSVLYRYIQTRGQWQPVSENIDIDSLIYATRFWVNSNFFPLQGGLLTGTGGAGYVGFPLQSSTPSTPATGFSLFAGSTGNNISWMQPDGFFRRLVSPVTGVARQYQFMARSYTLADSADVAALPTGAGTTNYYAKWSSTNALGIGNLFDNNTYVGILNSKPFSLGQWTTAGRPTGVQGYMGYNTTTNGLDWYNGTRWATGLESTFARSTAGSILFGDANGQATQNNANLFWDNTNARLGIGIGTPLVKLDLGTFGSTSTVIRAGRMEQTIFSSGYVLADNIFYNGTNFVRRSAGTGSMIVGFNGEIQFRTDTTSRSANTYVANLDNTAQFKILGNGGFVSGKGLGATPNSLSGATFYHNGSTGQTAFGSASLPTGVLVNFDAQTRGIRFPMQTLAQADAITGVQGNFQYETTQNGLRWYNGTRKAYALESTFARGTATRIPYFDANGQLTNSGALYLNSDILTVSRGTISAVDIINSTTGYRYRFGIDKSAFSQDVFAFVNLTASNTPFQMYPSGNTVFAPATPAGGSAQNFEIASAGVRIYATNKGFLTSQLTESQKNAISVPADGLMIYQKNATKGIWIRDSVALRWKRLLWQGDAVNKSGYSTIDGSVARYASAGDSIRLDTNYQFTSSKAIFRKPLRSPSYLSPLSSGGNYSYIVVPDISGDPISGYEGKEWININGQVTNKSNDYALLNIGGFIAGGSSSYFNTLVSFYGSTTGDFDGVTGLGYAVTLRGSNATAIGRRSDASAAGIAIGGNAIAGVRSIAIGDGSTATGVSSGSFGYDVDNTEDSTFLYGSTFTKHKFRGVIEFSQYGTSATTSATLGKTESGYLASFATDGTLLEIERKRDTTVYIDDADYDWSAAITTAQIASRFNRVVFWMTTTAAAGSDSELTLHTPDVNLMQVEYLIHSVDEPAGFDNKIVFGTNNAVDSTNGLVTNYYPSAGDGIHVRAGLRSGVYKYRYSN